MEKQGRSGILFRCFKEHTKIGLDIYAGTCYNIVRKCGHRTSASISAFQAEEVGSIPIARSTKNRLGSSGSGRFSYSIAPLFTSPLFHSHDNAPSKIFEGSVVILYSYGRSLTSRSSSAAQTRRRPERLSSFLCTQYAHIMLTFWSKNAIVRIENQQGGVLLWQKPARTSVLTRS